MLDLEALEELDTALANAVEIRPQRAKIPVAAKTASGPAPICPHLARMAAE